MENNLKENGVSAEQKESKEASTVSCTGGFISITVLSIIVLVLVNIFASLEWYSGNSFIEKAGAYASVAAMFVLITSVLIYLYAKHRYGADTEEFAAFLCLPKIFLQILFIGTLFMFVAPNMIAGVDGLFEGMGETLAESNKQL